MTKTQQAPNFFEPNPSVGAEFTMPRSRQYRRWPGGRELWAIIAACVLAVLMIVFATQLQAQISIVQPNLAGADSAKPSTALSIDRVSLHTQVETWWQIGELKKPSLASVTERPVTGYSAAGLFPHWHRL